MRGDRLGIRSVRIPQYLSSGPHLRYRGGLNLVGTIMLGTPIAVRVSKVSLEDCLRRRGLGHGKQGQSMDTQVLSWPALVFVRGRSTE